MECKIRAWNFSDAKVLPVILSDNGIRDHLRDGLPGLITFAAGISLAAAGISGKKRE